MNFLLLFLSIVLVLYLIFRKKKRAPFYTGPVAESWKKILLNKVEFYRQLSPAEKNRFEERIQHFLNTTRITGIKVEVNIDDKLLVAASAIIPVFAFPEWEYVNLSEVLLYPGAFNDTFQTGAGGSKILGMVGSGYMEGKMILSKPALHQGFTNERDKKNVGIHEFVHLIDKTDGITDGMPEVLMQKQYAIPWLDLVRSMMQDIHEANSDINPYGGINPQEFFSVTAEYFFERPKLLQKKHPELYHSLSTFFRTDLSQKFREKHIKRETGRNDPCPCGSGNKFKFCCGKIN